MSDVSKYGVLASGIGTLGIWSIYGSYMQSKSEMDAFKAIDSESLTKEQVWRKALEISKNDRRDLRARLAQVEAALNSVIKLYEVAEGFRSCQELFPDKTVDESIKIPIFEFWMNKFLDLFDIKIDFIGGLYDDKIIKKMSLLISNDKKEKCSFCFRSRTEAEYLIGCPNIYICDKCVSLSYDIIEGERTKMNGDQ